MTAKVRIEFARMVQPGQGGGELMNQPLDPVTSQVMDVTVAQLSNVAPEFGVKSGNPIVEGIARVTVLVGAVIVDWGDAPAVTEASSWRVETGQPLLVPIHTGQRLSIAETTPSSGAAGATGFDSAGTPFNPARGVNSTDLSVPTQMVETNVQGGVTRVKITTFAPNRVSPVTITEGEWAVQS